MKKLIMTLALVALTCVLCACGGNGHTHTPTMHGASAADCTHAGNTLYYECTDCGKYFADEACTEEITDKTSVIVPAAHDWDDGVTDKEPTCDAEGVKTISCKKCTETKTETLPATGKHVLSEVPYSPASCTENGNNAYWTCGTCENYFSDAEGKNKITDKNSVVITAAHSFKSTWNYNETKHWHDCENCSEKDGEAAHEFNNKECEICEYIITYTEGLTYAEYEEGYAVTGIGTATDVKDLIIPDTYDNRPVIRIEEAAFANGEFTSVTIPKSILSVGFRAFAMCYNLVKVNYLGNIADWANMSFYYVFDTSVNVPTTSSPMSFAQEFYLDGNLVTELTIPGEVAKVKTANFMYFKVKEITVQSGVTEIETYAFSKCENLIRVNIADSVTKIGKLIFERCPKIQFLKTPIAGITNGLFSSYFNELKQFGDDYIKVDQQYGTTGDMTKTFYVPKTFTDLIVTQKEITSYAFRDCGYLQNLALPNTTNLDSRTLGDCNLKTIYVSKNLESLSDYNYGDNTLRTRYLLTDGDSVPSAWKVNYGFLVTGCGEIKNSFDLFYVETAESVTVFSCVPTESVLTLNDKINNKPVNYRYDMFYNLKLNTVITSVNFDISILAGSEIDTLILPDGITTLTEDSSNGFVVKNLVIPASVTQIEPLAFTNSNVTVYYFGTAEQWATFEFDEYSSLAQAQVYYYSETEPVGDGNYWHYDGYKPVIW